MKNAHASFIALLTLVPLLSVGGFASSCVNPAADYADFVNRTNGLRGPPDTGPPPDVQVDPDAGKEVTGAFLASCLPALIGGDSTKAITFYVDATYKPEGTGGKLDLTFVPVKDDATKMDKSQTDGVPFGAKNVPVDDKGAFEAKVGNFDIPGDAQRLGDSLLQFENGVFKGRIVSPDRFCSELDGNLVAPLKYDLTTPGDTCIFIRLAAGSALPIIPGETAYGYAPSEFHCP